MQRYGVLAAAAVVAALVPAMMISGSTPASAVTAKQKMETCKFGADDQKLAGAARAAFMKKCMSNKNDPRGPAAGTPATTGTPAAPEGEEPDSND
jgi:hypothetical protein